MFQNVFVHFKLNISYLKFDSFLFNPAYLVVIKFKVDYDYFYFNSINIIC